MINFIFQILYTFGSIFLAYPWICAILIFCIILAIVIKIHAPKKSNQLDAAKRMLMADAARIKKESENTKKTEFVCDNCGAPLKAAKAVCEYCGMRSQQGDDYYNSGGKIEC